ncbi:MAG: DedA family protein [Nitrospirota bacterium]|nr:DedA family protein [Nitrospirota bacterium]
MNGFPVFIEHFHYLGLFILLILGGIGFPFPEDATLILCGFLISMKAVRPFPAIIAVYAGLLTADLILYFFGKKYGKKVVAHKKFRKIISPEKLQIIENRFNKFGVLLILIGRHVVGLRAQLFIVSGVMKMPTLKFLLTDAFSALLTISIMVGAGYIGGNSLNVIKKDITRIEHIVIVLIIFTAAGYLIFRSFKERRP